MERAPKESIVLWSSLRGQYFGAAYATSGCFDERLVTCLEAKFVFIKNDLFLATHVLSKENLFTHFQSQHIVVPLFVGHAESLRIMYDHRWVVYFIHELLDVLGFSEPTHSDPCLTT